PSFAPEVAANKHTWVVIAGTNGDICRRTQELFTTDTFHPFFSNSHPASVESVEVGGAVKNVIAIAAGIADGMDLGHNARAANITRGLYEMMKIGRAFGIVDPINFSGLSGIGDLALTCTSRLSRNYAAGCELGLGKSIDEIQSGMRMVAEGIPTADAVHRLAQKHSINVPICEAMYRILYEGLSPRKALEDLCTMPLKEELGALHKTNRA
ncbi:MAG: NAD(P)H-dependent glycerol-3-phosphate dehydrogenase, partial [bacterium]